MLASVVTTPGPASARQPTWSGPNDVAMVGLVSADDAQLVAAGKKSFFIWREQDWSADGAPTRLVGTRVTDGGPTELSYAAAGTRINSLQAPARGSASGVTVAWYDNRLVGRDSGATYLSTAEFDGDSWSEPTVHFEEVRNSGSGTRASGYAITQDAAGNVTVVWREIADDYATGQLRMSYSMLARSRPAGGEWGQPIEIQAFPQFGDFERKEFTSSGPRLTSMSDGRLLLCSSRSRQSMNSVTPIEEIQCWTSPSAGAAWTALPAVQTTTAVWQPVLLGDGVPMLVMTGWSMPVSTIYRGGSWTPTAPIAPDPPTQRPAPLTGAGFVLAEDGVGVVHVVQLVGDRVMQGSFESDYLSSIYVASNAGGGWSTWRRVSGVFQPPFNEFILSPKASALPGSLLVTWVQGQHYDAYTQADRSLLVGTTAHRGIRSGAAPLRQDQPLPQQRDPARPVRARHGGMDRNIGIPQPLAHVGRAHPGHGALRHPGQAHEVDGTGRTGLRDPELVAPHTRGRQRHVVPVEIATRGQGVVAVDDGGQGVSGAAPCAGRPATGDQVRLPGEGRLREKQRSSGQCPGDREVDIWRMSSAITATVLDSPCAGGARRHDARSPERRAR